MSTSNRPLVRVITACTGQKQYSPDNQLKPEDFLLPPEQFIVREDSLNEFRMPAAQIYTGQQHVRLMRGIQAVSDTCDVELWILSAGYGLIPGTAEIVPYEMTFQTMRAMEIDEVSQRLQIPQRARDLLSLSADLTLLLVGKDYLRALNLGADVAFGAPTVILTGSEVANSLPKHTNVKIVGLDKHSAQRYRCGLVGLKGEIAGRFLTEVANKGSDYLVAAAHQESDFLEFVPVPAPRPVQIPARARPERVEFIIKTPLGGWTKPHQKKLRFFIPDWDDHVDPDYDFLTDTHAGGRGNRSNQMFAHQLYDQPNYDGLLVSKMVADESENKRTLLSEIGIHQYLRIPSDFPVMGDCGAFSYLLQDTPPYTTDEILDYYTRLDFTYGVSIDHLLFGADTKVGQAARYEMTIQNAEDFLREHRARELPWTPIGAIQGENPAQYAQAARQYLEMGYTHIGLGGMVRSKTNYILAVAQAVKQVIRPDTQVHLFGVARLGSLNEFVRHGITSVDSASYLRQAWMRFGQNYIGAHQLYAALRIPEAENKVKHVKDLYQAERIRALERLALNSVRQYANRNQSISTALEAVLEYSEVIGLRMSPKLADDYRLTLEHRPWEQCDCTVCKTIGVEIILFRGNNRNRRRGFHNTYVFYRLMQQVLLGGSALPIPEEWQRDQHGVQLRLFDI